MTACSGVVWSRTTQSGLRSLGGGVACGALPMRFEKFEPVAFAPRLKEPL